MSQELVLGIYVFVMAIFVGFEVISRVPSVLHTPLMSGTNAIHGIVVLGAIIVLGSGVDGWLSKLLLVIAVAFGTINVVGGFLVTDRMLGMFKGKKPEKPEEPTACSSSRRASCRTPTSSASSTSSRSASSSTA